MILLVTPSSIFWTAYSFLNELCPEILKNKKNLLWWFRSLHPNDYCLLLHNPHFYLISDFKNWVKKLFLAYFYRSFSLPHNIAVRRPILNFKTIFCIYIQFSFILYKIDFLYLHYFWVKIAFEVRRSDFVIVFLKTGSKSVQVF